MPRQIIDEHIDAIRRENYGMERRLGMGGNIMQSLPDLQLAAFHVEEGSPAAGKSIGEIQMRKEHGVTAAGVRHDDAIDSSPSAQTLLLPGDVVYLLATQEKLTAAAWLFRAPEQEAVKKEHVA